MSLDSYVTVGRTGRYTIRLIVPVTSQSWSVDRMSRPAVDQQGRIRAGGVAEILTTDHDDVILDFSIRCRAGWTQTARCVDAKTRKCITEFRVGWPRRTLSNPIR